MTVMPWEDQLIAWAVRTNAVSELWLFGSHAKGNAHSGSDVDIAVSLMPPIGKHDWAFGDYIALVNRDWRPEIERIVGGQISFGAITTGDDMDVEVRKTGRLLWKRPLTASNS